ncbi:sigma-70 family RNA polymerase sigma factor [Paractinoplanes atraurantiacus]|uniref:RNA polymerase sigma factor, sigma-70 family n=1 Tax=Paractinoplanes atraurantiacus TaxID=1036182 RepID=A0A285K4A4_9ACTN|nr:sigma-70 family RNA polymerase sigma factor [Actinoplanes atraurantiacus]SNY67394.1 RNA polymerase sigma factor, sigma-70 family [Actinoplanes atraurantiacus]
MTAEALSLGAPAETGDLAAFWSDYAPALRRRTHYLLTRFAIPACRLDPDDILQSVYEQLLVNWGEIRQPRAYARSRAEVAVLEALRAEQRLGPSLDSLLSQGIEMRDRALGADESLIMAEEEARVTAMLAPAMDELSPQQRRAVELCDEQGRTRVEAASEMGIRPGTVSLHHARAMTKLRAAMLGPALAVLIVGGTVGAVIALIGARLQDYVVVGLFTAAAFAPKALARLHGRRNRRPSRAVVSARSHQRRENRPTSALLNAVDLHVMVFLLALSALKLLTSCLM